VIACEHCEDGVIWLGRCGGLDPAVTAYECEQCHGTGNASCAETGCSEPATRLHRDDHPLCAEHYAIWEEDYAA
jgi:hypothetical protein